MKTTTKVLTAAAVFVVALSLAAPMEATCGASTTIQGSAAGEGTSYMGIQPFFDASPYYGYYGTYPPVVSGYGDPPPALTPNARASFWMLGAGDPAPGFGNDNGAYNVIGSGIYFYSNVVGSYGYHRGATININWENGPTDNCLEAQGDCLCMLITDDYNNQGYFAVTGAMADGNLNTTVNQGGSGQSPVFNAPIVLVPIPGPTITSTSRDQASNNLTVGVSVNAAPGLGDYSKDGCNCAPVGYKILQSSVPFGDMPPQDRDIAMWSEPDLAAGGPQPTNGSPLTSAISILTDCSGGSTDEVYLTTALVFDSAFGTTQVSGSSTRMECDPTLAKPGPRARPDRDGKERPKVRRR